MLGTIARLYIKDRPGDDFKSLGFGILPIVSLAFWSQLKENVMNDYVIMVTNARKVFCIHTHICVLISFNILL